MESTVQFNLDAKATPFDMQTLTKDESVIKIYGNAFQTQLTMADGSIVIKHNEVPVALLTMSLTSIKGLADQLKKLVDAYSGATGEQLFSAEEVVEKMKNKQEKK